VSSFCVGEVVEERIGEVVEELVQWLTVVDEVEEVLVQCFTVGIVETLMLLDKLILSSDVFVFF